MRGQGPEKCWCVGDKLTNVAPRVMRHVESKIRSALQLDSPSVRRERRQRATVSQGRSFNIQ